MILVYQNSSLYPHDFQICLLSSSLMSSLWNHYVPKLNFLKIPDFLMAVEVNF